MKFARFQIGPKIGLGIVECQQVVDLKATISAHEPDAAEGHPGIFGSLTRFVESGAEGMALARRAVELHRQGFAMAYSISAVRLLAPLQPKVILCSGENYWDHREEKPVIDGREPEFFVKVPLGVIGANDSILLDHRVTQKLDYECELAIVIGKEGRHIPRASALDYVFGYTIMNDVTARDRQVRMRPDGTCSYALGPGKNFDTCAPLGPVVVTKDEIPDPQSLNLQTVVNGELRQFNSTAKMIWAVAELVEFFSVFLTLRPGVVISTGTPGGTGWGNDTELGGRRGTISGLKPGRYLQPGDRVACEIEGIGMLCNDVVAVD